MKYVKNTFPIFIIFIFSLILGCSKFKAGDLIPGSAIKVNISKINNNSKNIVGKKILVVGNFSGVCGSGCCKEFMLRQGINQIKIDPNRIKIRNFKIGLPLKIYGILKTTKTSHYLLALGIEEI